MQISRRHTVGTARTSRMTSSSSLVAPVMNRALTATTSTSSTSVQPHRRSHRPAPPFFFSAASETWSRLSIVGLLPRCYHSATLLGSQIFIFGGKPLEQSAGFFDELLVLDLHTLNVPTHTDACTHARTHAPIHAHAHTRSTHARTQRFECQPLRLPHCAGKLVLGCGRGRKRGRIVGCWSYVGW